MLDVWSELVEKWIFIDEGLMKSPDEHRLDKIQRKC